MLQGRILMHAAMISLIRLSPRTQANSHLDRPLPVQGSKAGTVPYRVALAAPTVRPF